MENKIYRFKIQSKEFYDHIIDFANLHKYDDTVTLKEQFKLWCETEEIMPYIAEEENLLIRNHYNLQKTSIYDKIYKSIKYYHIKNMLKFQESDDSFPIKKKKNIKFSKEFIQLVKQYLMDHYQKKDFKPSLYYTFFFENNKEMIQKEIMNINQEKNYENTFMESRIKKMFKNQYFTMIHR